MQNSLITCFPKVWKIDVNIIPEPLFLLAATVLGLSSPQWIGLALAGIGHFALHLTIYNRINATGLPRSVIKIVKWFFLAICLIVPIVVVWRWPPTPTPMWLWIYGGLCVLTLVYYGPKWLLSRPALNSDAFEVQRAVQVIDVQKEIGQELAVTRKCRFYASLPLNQIFQLSVEQKELPVIGLPKSLDGYKLAHLSDIHLTGHVSPKFYEYVIQRAVQWQPDLIAMTGDILDKKMCLDWLPACFQNGSAVHGCYFVLGNHDLRIRDPRVIRQRLSEIGWRDVGGDRHVIDVNGTDIELLGNESPWFPAVEYPHSERPGDHFRLLLSHSPDQIPWAASRGVHLMLAGHTHGGQGRLPWIGPVFSPSYFGSRYASGTFYIEPTTVHVTRGLSGVHLMRINCRPELALLTLRSG